MANYPKYVLKKSTNQKFYWNLHAVNGQIILTSEIYESKQGALGGIGSSKRCVKDSNFSRRTSTNMQYYFNQVADNGEIIGTSEMYTSIQSRENGIEAVKRDAPIAEIEDLT